MLKLFKVEDRKEVFYFADRRAARTKRDTLNEAGKNVVVCRGPDHRRGESFNKSHFTPGKASRGW